MKPVALLIAVAATLVLVWAVVGARESAPTPGESAMNEPPADPTAEERSEPDAADGTHLATFGAGCFWCVEAVFQELDGVLSVESGYSNGLTDNPTYKQVCSGTTGYAEVIRIRYDPTRVPYARLLEVFWKTHDPTTLNRQGADVGTQYRSAVFFHDEEQRREAEALKAKLDASGAFGAPIVTEIAPVERYVRAEEDHQDYWARNPDNGYCRAVIPPKLEKFRKAFKDHLKTP